MGAVCEEPPVVERTPSHGPLGEAWRDAGGRWRVRLTPAGRETAAEVMRRHPNPVALLKRCWPALYGAAVKGGLDDEELNPACAEGIVWGVIRHRPDKGALTTSLAWSVRAVVQRLVGRENRERYATFTDIVGDRVPGGGEGDGVDRFREMGREDPEPHGRASEELDALAGRVSLTPGETQVLAAMRRVGMSPGLLVGFTPFESKQRAEQVREDVLDKLRVAAGVVTRVESEGDRLADLHERRVLRFVGRRGRRRSDLWEFSQRELGLSLRDTGWMVDSLVEVGSLERVKRGMYAYYRVRAGVGS